MSAQSSRLDVGWKTIETEILEIAYSDDGDPDSEVVLLLHGWPESPLGFEPIRPALHEVGFRTIVPFLRGFGPTRFLATKTPRVAMAAALAQDAFDLMDRLSINRFSVIGHDWGARTGYALAALAPERINSLCALSVAFQPRFEFKIPPYDQSQRFWYQFFLCSDKGKRQMIDDPIGFSRAQWDSWSPAGWFSEAIFQEAAEAWNNPDYPAITLSGYRSRWLDEEVHDPRYDTVQAKLNACNSVRVPTLMIQGESDFCDPPTESEGFEHYFTENYGRLIIPRVGHFPHREAPSRVAEAVIERLKLS